MGPTCHVTIVVPVCDDWACLAILAGHLRDALAPRGWSHAIVAVDDGSREAAPPGIASGASVVLRLARNVGHQRAIAIGLDYVLRERPGGVLAIMDADGEDRPEDLPRLLDALGEGTHPGGSGHVVVASRRRRSEGGRFVAFYALYKATFRILTGERLDFGNFCALDRPAARRLVAMHELWLNLPATVMRSRLEVTRLPTDRGRRYVGRSRMNLVGLVSHGLSAVGVFSERAFTRTLVGIGSVAVLMLFGLVAGLVLKAEGLATPGWLTTIAMALVVVLVQTAMVALCGLFVVFGNAAHVVQSPAATARGLIESVTLQESSRVALVAD